jgi:undecaprenyl-diphosphatase
MARRVQSHQYVQAGAPSVFEAIVLGIVQGLTEFLPVSSSAHLIVTSWLMEGKPIPIAVNLSLHVGTIAALLFYFWRDWWKIALAAWRRVTKQEKSFESDTLLPALIVGCIPAALIGVKWEHDIERLFHHPASVAIPLLLVGIALWLVDSRAKGQDPLERMTIKKAFIIGLAQATALIPGVSRSGSTILAGRAVGFDRTDAARFSFLLGTPVTAGGVILNLKEMVPYTGDPSFYVGILVSGVVGCFAIGFLLQFLRRFGFAWFAVYRAALAIVILALVYRG